MEDVGASRSDQDICKKKDKKSNYNNRKLKKPTSHQNLGKNERGSPNSRLTPEHSPKGKDKRLKKSQN